MICNISTMQRVAVAACLSVSLAAVPACAREAPVGDAATSAAPAHGITRSAILRSRVAASHLIRRPFARHAAPRCSGPWYGRQFVLMLGIAF